MTRQKIGVYQFPIEFYGKTAGQMAKAFAKRFPEDSGKISVVVRQRKRRKTNFIFHDGAAKAVRRTTNDEDLMTSNGMCFNCGFLSVEQDLYLITGEHPEGGRVVSGEGARIQTVIAERGYGYACSQCKRKHGWTGVKNQRLEVFQADFAGYIAENVWATVEPLPEHFKLDRDAPWVVKIDAIKHDTVIWEKEQADGHTNS